MKKLALLGMVLASLILGCTGVLAGESYVVASDVPWAPFEMASDDGGFFGFDLDLIQAIAWTAGFEVEIRNIAFDAIVEMVRTGTIDIGASGMTITPERAATVDFSQPYYLSNQAVVVTKDSGVNLVSALTGNGPKGAVGAQNATSGFWWAEDNLLSDYNVDLHGYETYPSAVLDLVNGRIDAVIQDEPASQASLAAYPETLKIAGIINTQEYFGFLVQQGDPSGLLPKINAALSDLGLTVETSAGGVQTLTIAPGSFVEGLTEIYFGPDLDDVTAAWSACKDLLLSGDLEAYVAAMKDELGL